MANEDAHSHWTHLNNTYIIIQNLVYVETSVIRPQLKCCQVIKLSGYVTDDPPVREKAIL